MSGAEQERRATGRERVPFEALVAVSGQGQSAYECEAVDLSTGGVHLRTAYLPATGQTLTCRFDTGAGEVEAQGSVAWRHEQAKGGEFGVVFTSLDAAGEAAIRAIVGTPSPAAPAASAEAKASPGSRVRLHIDGLGSPMRARVRDADTGAIMVGSNLEFLRVGRPLELEDVEHGKKRNAVIDKVDVELDPKSNVPQLMVRLRYEGAKGEAPAAAHVASAKHEAEHEAEALETGGEAGAPAEDDEPGEPGAFEAWKGRAAAAFSALGPRLAEAGLRAREALGGVASRVRAARGQAEAAPLRTTTEIPEGGLGGRSIRERRDEELSEQEDEAAVEAAPARKPGRRLAVIGGAVGVALALVIVGVKSRPDAPPGAEAAAGEAAETNAAAATTAPPAGRTPTGGAVMADAVTANVPLFGSTPLSTTEAAAAAVPTTTAPGMPTGLTAPAPVAGPAPSQVGEPDDADDKVSTSYGKGSVKNGHTVRLKMDAPIASVNGSVSGSTLTVSLPGRHNIEPAATLAKKDKRIAGVRATPSGDGTDVAFTFKEGVPPFLAKANGKTLEVAFGEASKASADDDGEPHSHKHHGKKGATAHKTGKDDKKGKGDAKKGSKSHKKK